VAKSAARAQILAAVCAAAVCAAADISTCDRTCDRNIEPSPRVIPIRGGRTAAARVAAIEIDHVE
jgi:hypothetical protein